MLEFLELSELTSVTSLRFVLFFASISVLISSLEYLTLLPHFGTHGLFSERVVFGTSSWSKRTLGQVFSPRVMAVIFCVRGLAAIWCLSASTTYLAIPVVAMTLGQIAIHYRCHYGLEGSDQMTMILLVMLTVTTCFYTETVRQIALGFIAAQVCLSYLIAGIGKLLGATWRDGTAVRDVLRTRQNGHEFFWRLARHSRFLSVLSAYLVIAFECMFPFSVLLTPEITFAFLVAGCAFHCTNAVAMGLNGFVWSFVGTYPAVLYWAMRISQGSIYP